MKLIDQLRNHKNVEFADDERAIGNGIIITLNEGLAFEADVDCGVRGFDTLTDALAEVRTAIPRRWTGDTR